MVDTSIEQPTRHLLVMQMASVSNNFGLRRIVVVNEDRSEWYEGGLIPHYVRTVGEILPAYSDEPYEQTLMRHGCTWVQPTTAPLSTEQKQQLSHVILSQLQDASTTSPEVIQAINDCIRLKIRQSDDRDALRTAFIEQMDKTYGPVIGHTAGLDRMEFDQRSAATRIREDEDRNFMQHVESELAADPLLLNKEDNEQGSQAL